MNNEVNKKTLGCLSIIVKTHTIEFNNGFKALIDQEVGGYDSCTWVIINPSGEEVEKGGYLGSTHHLERVLFEKVQILSPKESIKEFLLDFLDLQKKHGVFMESTKNQKWEDIEFSEDGKSLVANLGEARIIKKL